MLNGLSSRSFRILVAGFVGVAALTIGWTKTSATPAKIDTELLYDIKPVEPAAHQSHVRTILMEVTAYCACPKCCGPNAHGLTASGLHVNYNEGKFVAADTSVLPFRTKLMIPGYSDQPVEVIDRGSAIKGNKLDVFFSSHEDAMRWGRRKIEVSVIE